MNLLIVTGIFPPDAGGPATYVPRIGEALMRRGHVVTVVTLSDAPEGSRQEYPFRLVRIRRQLPRPLRAMLVVLAILRLGRRADVLFVNGLYLEAVLANAWLGRPMVHKVVGDWAWEQATNRGWTENDFEAFQRTAPDLRAGLLKALRTVCARQADTIIVPSRFLARCVAGWGVSVDRIHVVYNAAEPPGGPADVAISLRTASKLIAVGRLVRWKGLEGLIGAVARLSPDVGLVIAGDGPEEARLRTLAAHLRVEDRVFFLGRLSRAQVEAALRACDALVLNSTYEGLPHVVLEAMQVGLPVIAARAGGVEEVVEHERTGMLVPPGDQDALERALALVLADAEGRREMGRRGRELVADRFSPARMVEDTETVLRQIRDCGRRSWSQTLRHAVLTVWRLATRGFGGQVAALTTANGLSAFLASIQTLVVARALGPELYGVVALIIGYPSLLFSVLDARSSDVSIKYLSDVRARNAPREAIAICCLGYLIDLTVGGLTCVAVAATAGWAESRVVKTPGTATLMVVYAAGLLFRAVVGTSYTVMAVANRFDAAAWVEGTVALVRTGLVIVLLLLGFGIAGVIWSNAIGFGLQGVAYGILAHSTARRLWGAGVGLPSARDLAVSWREMRRLLAYSELHGLLLAVPRQVDLMLVGYLRGPGEAGYYRLGRSFQSLVWVVGAPLQAVTLQRLSRAHGEGGWDATRRLLGRLAWLGAPLGVAMAMLIAAVPQAIRLLVGEPFLSASGTARILLLGTTVWLVLFWVRPALLAAGRVDAYTRWFAVSLLPFAVSAVYLAPRLGAEGMAMGYLAHAVILLVPLAVRSLRTT